MMLLLLLSLASAHLFSVEAVTVLDGPKDLNTEDCPLTFYGVTHDTLYVRFSEDQTQNYCFGKEGDRSLDTDGDCFIVPAAATSPTYELIQDVSALSSEITSIRNGRAGIEDGDAPECALVMRMKHKDDTLLLFISFGSKAAVYVRTTLAKTGQFVVTVNGQDKGSHNIFPDQSRTSTYSLMGCRVRDEAVYREQLSATMLDGCIRQYCTADATLEDRDGCEGEEVCVERRCLVMKKCAVAGNSVIDNQGQTASIDTFCEYRLLKSMFFELSGSFAERRLGDVPLLDTLKITTDKGAVMVHQGGVVTDQSAETKGPTTVSEDATELHGLTFAKVDGGVAIVFTVPIFNAVFEMFFDGTGLHVTQTSSSSFSTSGLCTNVVMETPEVSALISCEAPQNDPRGDGIDCDTVTHRCEAVLSAAPFAQCSVDRAGFVGACSNLLCHYPDKDGLFCHLLDAYAHFCQLQDWRDAAGCPVSQCYFRKCVYENEFCGLSKRREPGCFCRSSFAAPYRAKDSLGADEVVCANTSASVSLLGCLLEEKGVDPSSLHLNSPQCSGVHDSDTNTITFSFNHTDNCNATVTVDGSRIIYTNVIKRRVSDGLLTRQDPFSVEFSCAFVQPEVQTMSLKVKDSSVMKVMDAGQWTYVFVMEVFTDPALTKPVESEVRLDQPLWVRVQTLEVDGSLLSLVIEACWATKENNADAVEKYELIKDGCSVEESTRVGSNGAALFSVFSFRVFHFVASTDVFLHCNAKLCLTSTGCTKAC